MDDQWSVEKQVLQEAVPYQFPQEEKVKKGQRIPEPGNALSMGQL